MTSNRKYLRWYIRIQIVLLCLLLGTLGACLAAQRTRYIAEGAPVVSQRESPLPQTVRSLANRLPDMPDFRQIEPYLTALPAPFGCAIGVVDSIRELWPMASDWALSILHKD